MDLNTIDAVASPTERAQLWPLGPGDAVLAGGTWLFSEPQAHLNRLVDLTALRWQPITLRDGAGGGLELAATCTLERIADLSASLPAAHPDWQAAPLFRQCCTALLASFKVWRTATIGGNVCLSYPAGAMISLISALDGELTIWREDGTDRRSAITSFVTGDSTNSLAPAEIVRSVQLPAAALRARTAFRKLAPSPLGRSAIVVIGRRDTPADGGRFAVSFTAATVRPYVFDFPAAPAVEDLRAAHATIPDDGWTGDAHGDPDWRRGVSLLLAEQVLTELT